MIIKTYEEVWVCVYVTCFDVTIIEVGDYSCRGTTKRNDVTRLLKDYRS